MKRCKFGVNKNTGSCLKSRRAGTKKSGRKASAKGCKYGKLKNPSGRRRCRKRPRKGRRR